MACQTSTANGPPREKATWHSTSCRRPAASERGSFRTLVGRQWLLAEQPWIVPIPGTRRLERSTRTSGAADLDLTPEDLTELDEASTNIQVQGDRYPEAMQRMIDR